MSGTASGSSGLLTTRYGISSACRPDRLLAVLVVLTALFVVAQTTTASRNQLLGTIGLVFGVSAIVYTLFESLEALWFQSNEPVRSLRYRWLLVLWTAAEMSPDFHPTGDVTVPRRTLNHRLY